ncbi:porin [Burkholderia multivorans]|uniref:porin n=1 Tax=Burkholderia multivorans TaxID=87883 RepID=UPI003BF8E111|nr:porin [Burkholderia multivorans]MCO8610409.1 porin [Burkholderia multivorans]MCO8633304.1 porin [Burkholderia multivorans]MCO8637224.1 porin [Burkholderia multivorans]MCO8647107.1 porin [Burkholderia multivorans]
MINGKACVIGMLSLVQVGAASAQSSVTLFGLLDAGISYVSNEGGHGNAKFDDGIFTPSLIGLRGREDLGGGAHAIFELVSQIAIGNGTAIGNGLFARTAFVGLQHDRYGSLTFGNQYEFMADTLFLSGADAARDVGGLYNLRNGPFRKLALPGNPTGAFDWDRLAGSQRVPGAVKYVSPTLDGLRFGVLYGFGGVPGSIGANNTVSVGVDYSVGPFGVAAAYTNEKYGAQPGSPAASVRNWGAGMRYGFGVIDLGALLTTVRNTASGGAVWMSEFGGTWKLSAATTVGADYMYMKGNAALDNDHAHQLTATIRYALSKRTMVYASGAWQRANVGAHAQINGVLDPDGASSGANQAIARIGIHTVF